MSSVTWLEEGRLAASAYPDEADLAALSIRGITVLINLHRRPHDCALLRRYGLTELHLPVPDFTPPAPEQLDAGVATIEQALASGTGVVVHCAAGLGRTGTLLACYLIRGGASPEAAIARVRAARPGALETPAQVAAVGAYAVRLRPTRTVIQKLADSVMSVQVAHPTRVAVKGRSAAGKTTLAEELAEAIRSRGREVLRASIDDFHRPGPRDRSRRGEWTPASYDAEGYDYEAFKEMVLEPLDAEGDRRCRTALFDAYRDIWLPEGWHEVGPAAILIVDGVFLLHPRLAGCWDYRVWLDIDMETMVTRARERDVAWVGSEDLVVERYRRHWIPTHKLYEHLANPIARADAVIDTRDLQKPEIRRLRSSRGG
jgi:uridine kinase